MIFGPDWSIPSVLRDKCVHMKSTLDLLSFVTLWHKSQLTHGEIHIIIILDISKTFDMVLSSFPTNSHRNYAIGTFPFYALSTIPLFLISRIIDNSIITQSFIFVPSICKIWFIDLFHPLYVQTKLIRIKKLKHFEASHAESA